MERERGNKTALTVHHPSIATNHLPAVVRPLQLLFSIEQRAVERDKSKVISTVNDADMVFHPNRTSQWQWHLELQDRSHGGYRKSQRAPLLRRSTASRGTSTMTDILPAMPHHLRAIP